MRRFPLVSVLIFLCLAGCTQDRSRPPSPLSSDTNRQIYTVQGEIRELKPDRRTVVIKHEEIPGYMSAMTMPFRVLKTNELTGLNPGDRVVFQMVVTPETGWIEQLKKIAPTQPPQPQKVESVRIVRDVDPLEEGRPMPDYQFTNELRQTVRWNDMKGKAFAFTFIFTRCPFPDFCPRMTANFAEASRQLAALPNGPDNWHLFSVSFDVGYDTPDVLKAYAQNSQYDPKHWSFLTGALIDIDAITEQVGMYFAREPSGITFDHNLRTVVVDAKGVIQKIFIGNEWKPAELVSEIAKAAQVK